MKVNYEDLFEHIGYLVYSIVLPCGTLSENTILKLKNIVGLVWKENDSLSMHLNDCAVSGVEYCVDNSMTSDHAFESFKNYFMIHSLPFGVGLREKIIAVSQSAFEKFPSQEGAVKLDHIVNMMSTPKLQKQ